MGRDWDTTPQTPNMFEQRVTGHGPNMFEQRFPGPPPTQPWSGYQSQPTPSFGPGQYVTMQDTGRQEYEPDLPMQTPNSAQPFFSPMGQTPLGSPISVAPYGSVFDNQPVSRQNSAGPSAYLSRQPSTNAGTLEPPEAHYVDLSRSSVTPFQAQQYEEISRRLNVPPPAALPAVAEHPVIDELPVEHIVAQSEPSLEVHAVTSDEVQATTKSPFADPEGRDSPMVTPGALPDPEDGDNTSIDGFPQPPSPTFTTSSRINSTPPVLPEIQVQQRAFSPTVMEFPLVPGASRPAPAPSPLASSHTPPTPPASAHIADKPVQLNTIQVHAESANQSRPQRDELAVNRPDTVYTLYDDEDAYGGI